MKLKLPRRLGEIKIGTRLALSFAAILLLMMAALAYIGESMNLAEERSNNMFEDDIVKLELVQQLSDSTQMVTRAMRTLMLLPRGSEGVKIEREKITDGRKKYDDAMVTVFTLPSTEKGQALITKLEQDIENLRSVDDKILALNEQGKRDDAVDVLVKQGMPAFYEWQGVLDEYAALQKSKAEEAKQAIAQKFKETVQVSITLSALVLLLSAAAAFLITRSITSPLNKLQQAINEVRQGGDMGSLAHIDSKDEFSDMGFAVDQVLQDQISAREKETAQREQADLDRQKAEAENEKLNNSVIALLQAVNQLSQRDLTARAPLSGDIIDTVADSINQLTDETAKVLNDMNMIAQQVAQVSVSVRSQGDLVATTAKQERENVVEMVGALGESADNMERMASMAEESNRSAERASQATNTALETVNNTVKGMESIRETIAETEKRIKRLGERSQEISGIVNLINTISERTHVLALNASMQAAVAGEAGRGFAVVAEEVQRLAESSRLATQQISTLVSNIQLETNETISTVNRTIGQVVQGSEQAQKAGEQMRLTQAITGELAGQVRTIAEAQDEQKAMSILMLEAVKRLGQSNERTAQQIGTQAEETHALVESAQLLVESVSLFKLPQLA
jgi:methyl-accepting chemotaxis protein